MTPDKSMYPLKNYGDGGGLAYDPARCAALVIGMRVTSWQCTRLPGHGDRGLFCTQHAGLAKITKKLTKYEREQMQWERKDKARALVIKALRAMKRCPGIGSTDQETGETFDTMLDAALAVAGDFA